MILARVVFQAKFGKANEIVAHFRSEGQILGEEMVKALQPRILTDLSGSFDTVIIETTHESLAAFEEFRKGLFARQAESGAPSPLSDLVVSGRNEYYTIEEL